MVATILLSKVSFSHADSVPLIVDLDLQIESGWTGVVGPNGAGKTTLLELLAGDREPDTGSVRFHPPDLRSQLCPQTVDRCTPEVALFAEASEGQARRIRGQLGLEAHEQRSAEVGLGRETQKLRGRLDRLADQAKGFDFHKALGRSLEVDYVPSPAPRLMSLAIEELRVGDAVLLREVHVQVERESRVHLAGPNGAGKTTLLGRLMGALRVPASRVLYLPQEFAPSEELALLEELRESASPEQGRVLAIVAALGVDPDALLASARPSPGEARKLALAFGLARQVWALVLDEPTNHLDLPSIERIEAALSEYPGALVIVTHDDDFARRCTDTVWELRDGRISVSSSGDSAAG